MTDFLQDHPLLIVAVLIANSLWISLLCYCGLRFWIARYFSGGRNDVIVAQYVVDAQSTNQRNPDEPFSSFRNIIVVGHGHCPLNSNTTDEPPPKYSDIFPVNPPESSGKVDTGRIAN